MNEIKQPIMKKDYFKEGESLIDSVFAEWEDQIGKREEGDLNRVFYQLKDSFTRFRTELTKSGYEGYWEGNI